MLFGLSDWTVYMPIKKSLDIHLTAVLQGADRSLYRSTHFYVIFHHEISSVLFRFLKTHMKARLNAVL